MSVELVALRAKVKAMQNVVDTAEIYMRYHATYGCGAERMALGEALEKYRTLL